MEKPIITSYSFGSMKINNHEYTQDLIVSPSDIKTNWWRKEGHLLHLEDLEYVFKQKPNFLVIGTGASGRMKVPNSLLDILHQKYDLETIVKPTEKSLKIFNEKVKKGENVVGAFHLTC